MLDEEEVWFTSYALIALGFFLVSCKFSKWPEPQVVALIVFIVFFSADKGVNIGSIIFSIVLVLMISMSVVMTICSGSVLARSSLGIMLFVMGYLAMDINSMFVMYHDNLDIPCDEFVFFGLGQDPDWLNYIASIETGDLDSMRSAKRDLTERYHPINCPKSCRNVCTYTFSQIQKLGENAKLK